MEYKVIKLSDDSDEKVVRTFSNKKEAQKLAKKLLAKVSDRQREQYGVSYIVR